MAASCELLWEEGSRRPVNVHVTFRCSDDRKAYQHLTMFLYEQAFTGRLASVARFPDEVESLHAGMERTSLGR